MKKIFLLLISSVILLNTSVMYAWTTDAEEDCFSILKDRVSSTYWVDLTKVQLDPIKSPATKTDISTYAKFLPHREKHAWNPIYEQNRTNYASIFSNIPFIQSQMVGFWQASNFTFPLKGSGTYSAGTTYNEFRTDMIITLHNMDGSFLSCSYLRVSPRWLHNLSSIDQSNYFSNVFEGSWFNPMSTVTKNGRTYWTANIAISAIDFKKKPSFLIEVIAVMYNNKSDLFNEFEIYPHQVWWMTNSDATFTGSARMVDAQSKFLSRVYNNTCLKVIHPTTATLPSTCGWAHKSLSYHNSQRLKTVFHWIVPNAYADIDPIPWYEKILKESRWMVLNGGLPYGVWEKIQIISDVKFKTYLENAILPSFESNIIQLREQNGIVPWLYEQGFLWCGIKIDDRIKIVEDLIWKIQDPAKIDYLNLEYLDPKFWDCIIPYPDKRHKGKNFDHSFAWYKYTNQSLTSTGIVNIGSLNFPGITEEQANKLRMLIEKRNTILANYNTKKDAVSDLIRDKSFTGHISEQLKKIEMYQLDYEQETQMIDAEILAFHESIHPKTELKNNTESNESTLVQKNISSKLIYAIIAGLFGILLIGYGILRRKQ